MSNVPTGITAYRNPVTGELDGSYPTPEFDDRHILRMANEMASNRDGYGVAFYNDALLEFAKRLIQEERERCATIIADAAPGFCGGRAETVLYTIARTLRRGA